MVARRTGAERAWKLLEGVNMNPAIRFDGGADGWSRRRTKKATRLARLAPWMKGRVLETGAIVEALQALIEPGDAVALEGDNQ
jgi:malonate decarboxylase alpha subunit